MSFAAMSKMQAAKAVVAAAVSVGTLVLGGCTRGPRQPVQQVVPVYDVGQRSLQPQDVLAEARRTIADRYAKRERRMREIWEPGSLWNYLRVEQRDIDRRAVTLPTLLDIGQELFTIDFGTAQGLGNGLFARKNPIAGRSPAPNLRHVQGHEFGGPDATRCVACHHTNGLGGGGFMIDNTFLDGDGEHPDGALARNPKPLLGAAVLQQLAAEMTEELRAQATAAARSLKPGQQQPLLAKGVSFGSLGMSDRGRIDFSGLRGVGQDLVVRPFGWKGTTATLRQTIVEALQQNLGIQAEELLQVQGPLRAVLLGDGPPDDPDADGVTREATEGMVTALTTFIASLPLPVEEATEHSTYAMQLGRGAELFEKIGCASCHVPELPLQNPVVTLGPTVSSGPRLDLSPLLTPAGMATRQKTVRLYSDLRRHDMGKELAEPRNYRGVGRSYWLTPPLWGLSASAPYMHDGRAGSIEAAILMHGGEAEPAMKAYNALQSDEGAPLRLFLQSLGRPQKLEFKP